MVSKEYGSLESFARRRLSEAKSEKEVELCNRMLDRIALLERADNDDIDALIELGEEIWGTKND